jgi:hypothetical protein
LFLSARTYSQNCPLVKEYYKYNTGWLVLDTTVYSFWNNSMDTLHKKIPRKGKGIIFEYSAFYDCPDICDEERTDIITWSIPDSSSAFTITLTENNFKETPFAYTLAQFGYNRPKGLLSVTGSISGVKTNSTSWDVTGTLTVIAGDRVGSFRITRSISFSKKFTQTVYAGSKRKKKYAGVYPFYYEK